MADSLFFRELLQNRPELLLRIMEFNRKEHSADAAASSPLEAAVLRYPELAAALQTGKEEHFLQFWDFTEESERLALLPAEELAGLGKRAGAAVFAEQIAVTLAKAEVISLKDFLTEPVYRYAVRRGRFQTGSLAAAAVPLAGDGTLAERCRAVSSVFLWSMRAGWPAELQDKTAELFRSTGLPEPDKAQMPDRELRQRMWHFMKKIILRELDPSWARYFR